MFKMMLFVFVVILLVAGFLYFSIYRHVGYKIKDSKVYYVSWNEGQGMKEVLLEADLESFSKIDRQYAKDKSRVFFVGEPILNADPSTFRRIKVDRSKVEDVYSKDKNHVYKFTGALPEVDPTSFEALGGAYTKDSKHVFYQEKLISSAEAAGFKTLEHSTNGWFGLDRKQVYCFGEPIPGADPLTFRIVKSKSAQDDIVAQDKNRSYTSLGEPR